MQHTQDSLSSIQDVKVVDSFILRGFSMLGSSQATDMTIRTTTGSNSALFFSRKAASNRHTKIVGSELMTLVSLNFGDSFSEDMAF